MKKVIISVFLVISSIFFAQQIQFGSSGFDFLKDQDIINVEVEFENVLFLAENISEAEYLEKRRGDIIKNPKKSEEDWLKWRDEWMKYRETVYQERFIKGFNKRSKKIIAQSNAAAKYTIIVEPKWVFPGWHGGFVMQQAKISGRIKVVETQYPSNELAVIELEEYAKMINGSDVVMEYGRIAAGIESLGREVGGKMRRK